MDKLSGDNQNQKKPFTKILAVSNQKGGVGKTTTVINFAHCLAELGQKILVVDFDPQANATSGLGVDVKVDESIYAVLMNHTAAEDVVKKTDYEGLFLLPGSQELSGAQVELVGESRRQFRLASALAPLKEVYDYIIIDTPPSLGLLTINALCAATSVLIPIQCEYYALEGISQLLKTVTMVKKKLKLELQVEGIVLTMFDVRTNLSKEVMENVVTHFGQKTYSSIIPRNVKISEAPSHGLPIAVYDSNGQGAICYKELAKEFLSKQKTSINVNKK